MKLNLYMTTRQILHEQQPLTTRPDTAKRKEMSSSGLVSNSPTSLSHAFKFLVLSFRRFDRDKPPALSNVPHIQRFNQSPASCPVSETERAVSCWSWCTKISGREPFTHLLRDNNVDDS